MDPMEALAVMRRACEAYRGTRADHELLDRAYLVLHDAVYARTTAREPEPEPVTDARDVR